MEIICWCRFFAVIGGVGWLRHWPPNISFPSSQHQMFILGIRLSGCYIFKSTATTAGKGKKVYVVRVCVFAVLFPHSSCRHNISVLIYISCHWQKWVLLPMAKLNCCEQINSTGGHLPIACANVRLMAPNQEIFRTFFMSRRRRRRTTSSIRNYDTYTITKMHDPAIFTLFCSLFTLVNNSTTNTQQKHSSAFSHAANVECVLA